jgi:hypothetical protein
MVSTKRCMNSKIASSFYNIDNTERESILRKTSREMFEMRKLSNNVLKSLMLIFEHMKKPFKWDYLTTL